MSDNNKLIAEARREYDAYPSRAAIHPRPISLRLADALEAALEVSRVPTPAEGEAETTDENLWDWANDLLDWLNIEDENPPSLVEGIRDRFVARFARRSPVETEDKPEDQFADSRVPLPPRLLVDALGFVWQDGLPGFLSMARTTTRNIPSPGLIEYLPAGPWEVVNGGVPDE